MSDFDKEQLRALQKLCRIRLGEEEEDKLLVNLKNILQMIESLKEVDTQGVEPCNSVLKDFSAPLREDVAERLIPRDDFLKQAPESIGGLVKVPKVMKDQL